MENVKIDYQLLNKDGNRYRLRYTGTLETLEHIAFSIETNVPEFLGFRQIHSLARKSSTLAAS